MKTFFYPAIKLLNNLKYLQKFLLIGIIFVIPLAVVMYLLISEINLKINFAQKERMGIGYIMPLEKLLQHSLHCRTMAAMYANGDAYFKERIAFKQGEIDNDIKVIDEADRRLGSLLEAQRQWLDTKSKWEALKGHLPENIPSSSYDEWAAFHAALRSLITKAGDSSNLILDPDLDSYYLMDAVVNKIPLIAESLEQAGIFALNAVARKRIEAQAEQFLLFGLNATIHTTLALMNSGMQTAFSKNAGLTPKLEIYLRENNAAATLFLDLLNTKILNAEAIDISLVDYYSLFSNAIEENFRLYEAIGPALDRLLEARVYRFSRKKYFIEILAFIMLLAVGYFTIAFYLSVKHTVSSLDKVAEGMSGEHMEKDIVVGNKDELGEVVVAFNKIGNKLRESYLSLKSANEELERDISRRKEMEQRADAQYTVTRLLAMSSTLHEASAKILQVVCENLSWDLGALWIVNHVTDRLDCTQVWHIPELEADEFVSACRKITFAPHVGLPGRVWMNSSSSWIEDVAIDTNFPRAPFASKSGLHGAFGFPIRIGKEVVGVFEFFSHELRKPDAELLQMFDSVGSQIGQFIKRKQQEEEIRKLLRAIEQGPSAVVITDTTGTIEYVNPKFTQLTGYPFDEAVGSNIRILKSGETLPEVYTQLWGTITAAKEWRGELRNRKKNGDFYWEFSSISAITNAEGAITHFVAVKEDIAQRKEMERLKDEFVSMVSHELRTPMAVIKEGVSQVFEGLHGGVTLTQSEVLGISLENIERLGRIIDNLLDISKIEAGKLKLKKEAVDIVEVARGVIATFNLRVKNRNVALKENFSKEKIELSLDRDRIIQVFTNLLGNAMKFTSAGDIEISIIDKENSVECIVKDTGIGISRDDLPKLFSKFEQFSRSALPGEKGTGLGLSIAKEIVELHKGRIRVESELGKGTAFTFILPKI